MLVVESVVPGSASDGRLESGDVLVSINGQVVTHFLTMEELLDDAVHQEVEVVIERAGKPVRGVCVWARVRVRAHANV
jgi:S1-C subfamily serine protease